MPDQEEALISIADIEAGKNKVKIPEGRISGVGKTARGYIKQISNGSFTFAQVFNTDDGRFVIAR